MILIVGTVRLPPENLSRARAAMQAMIEASRTEDGCAHYSYAEDLLEPGLIRVQEMWRDEEALDRHFRSEHIARWRAAWPGLGLGARHLRAYDVGESRPV